MTVDVPGLYLATREDVKAALDIKLTARTDGQISKALESSTQEIESPQLLNRRFHPRLATRYWDWPNDQRARTWRIWLGPNEIVSASVVTSGGTVLTAAQYFLEPANFGPPYSHIEINLGNSASWTANSNTHQRAISILGLYGHRNDQATAGTLTATVSSTTATTIAVSDSSQVGVGDGIIIDTERLVVLGKTMADTGQNCSTLTASTADVTITGITAGTIAVDEVILVDGERMLVVDVAGTTLVVKRQWDGTTLAAHTNTADIFALRTLTVTRGILGSTAATHTSATAVYRQVIAGPVQELCVAKTLNTLLQKQSGYARMAGAGDNARESSGRGLKQALDAAMGFRRNRGPEAI